MDQKLLFVQACEGSQLSMTELCNAFGIARKTGYKWFGRYKQLGAAGLQELSRAPVAHPNAVEREVVDLITEARRWRPRWGGECYRCTGLKRHRCARSYTASTGPAGEN